MSRFLLTAGIFLLSAAWGCVYYGLDVEGKSCNSLHPCPPGFRCEELSGGDGGTVCKPNPNDGGDCNEGESRCVDFANLALCRSGDWRQEACGSGKYCFDAGGEIEAACVSECDESNDCTTLAENYYCNPDNQRCEEKGNCSPPDEKRCNIDGTQVLYCDPESGFDLVLDTCEENEYCHRSPQPVMCMPYCHDDPGCQPSPGTSCNLSSQRCVDLGLCQSDDDCPVPASGTSVCVGAPAGSPGACVIEPTEQATLPGGGNPELTCYDEAITNSEDPNECTLEGRVVMFFSRVPVPADQCSDVVVQLHSLEDILDGITDQPALTGQLSLAGTSNNEWQYRIESVPTNTPFVMEVRCDAAQAPADEYRTLFTFEVYIRADECLSPDYTYAFGAPVLYTANYTSYSAVGNVTPDPLMGLVFGWVKDCQGNKLVHATGGVSMTHELLYYLPDSGMPDPLAASTASPGFFAASNVLPIRGVASALVYHQTGPLSLRSREFRVFPDKASLVIFDRPKSPLP